MFLLIIVTDTALPKMLIRRRFVYVNHAEMSPSDEARLAHWGADCQGSWEVPRP